MMAAVPAYVYRRGQHGIFAEVYFPRRISAQGTIYTALEQGFKEDVVKAYLTANIPVLLSEIKEYQQIFDPRQYDGSRRKRKAQVTEIEAKERIGMYHSPFKGWSDYPVDGVWFNEVKESPDFGKPAEEATQVLRLLFRMESSFAEQAKAADCQDVLRLIIFRSIANQVMISDRSIWDKAEQNRFIKNHGPWPNRKFRFVKEHFELVAKEVAQWMDDCWLFMFGYLIRQFAQRVLEIQRPEEEIWVTSFFNLTINVMKYARP